MIIYDILLLYIPACHKYHLLQELGKHSSVFHMLSLHPRDLVLSFIPSQFENTRTHTYLWNMHVCACAYACARTTNTIYLLLVSLALPSSSLLSLIYFFFFWSVNLKCKPLILPYSPQGNEHCAVPLINACKWQNEFFALVKEDFCMEMSPSVCVQAPMVHFPVRLPRYEGGGSISRVKGGSLCGEHLEAQKILPSSASITVCFQTSISFCLKTRIGREERWQDPQGSICEVNPQPPSEGSGRQKGEESLENFSALLILIGLQLCLEAPEPTKCITECMTHLISLNPLLSSFSKITQNISGQHVFSNQWNSNRV